MTSGGEVELSADCTMWSSVVELLALRPQSAHHSPSFIKNSLLAKRPVHGGADQITLCLWAVLGICPVPSTLGLHTKSFWANQNSFPAFWNVNFAEKASG